MSIIGDFFSGIGSLASGLFKAATGCIGKVITGAVSALGALGNSVGGLLGGVLTKAAGMLGVFGSIIAGPLGPIVGPILVNILTHVAGMIMEKIAKKFGLMEEEDKIEEVGYRREEAAKHKDWKRPEDFENGKAYDDYLKVQIPEIDPEKLRKNLCRYTVVGIAAKQEDLAQELGIGLPKDILVYAVRAGMKQENVEHVIEAFQSIGASKVQLREFLMGELPAGKMQEIQKAIQQVCLEKHKDLYPDKSAIDILNLINAWRKAAKDDNAVANLYKPALEEAKADIQKQVDAGVKPEDVCMDTRTYRSLKDDNA